MIVVAEPVTAPEVRCSTCRGLIAAGGQEIHDHHPSCTYWSLRCRICEQPLLGTGARATHPTRPELCFLCGDALDVESHP